MSAHKLSEAPLFSGITDIDQRIAQMSDSWFDLFNHSKTYHQLIFERWTQAYGRFLDALKALDGENNAQLSPRQLVDLWSEIANEELLQLHRSDGFLKAQQAVIRAGTQYRLHEKSMAEVICEAMHIPTRDEVDELHKTVTELRRELRQVKNQLQQVDTKVLEIGSVKSEEGQEMNTFPFVNPYAALEEIADLNSKVVQGARNLSHVKDADVHIATTEKEIVFQQDKVVLYRYKSRADKTVQTPVLVAYGLIGRYTMADLQEDRSLIRNMLDKGIDIYAIDWGVPVALTVGCNLKTISMVTYMIALSLLSKSNVLVV